MAMSIDCFLNSISNNDLDSLETSVNADTSSKFSICTPSVINSTKKLDQCLKDLEIEERDTVVRENLLPGLAFIAERSNKKLVFVNIIGSDKIAKPSFTREERSFDAAFHWCIPNIILDPVLEYSTDIVQKQEHLQLECVEGYETLIENVRTNGYWVYDAVVNPISIDICRQDGNFKDILIDTIAQEIRKHLKVSIKNIKFIGFDICIRSKKQLERTPTKNSKAEGDYICNKFKETIIDCRLMPDYKMAAEKSSEVCFESAFVNGDEKENEKCKSIIPAYKLKYVSHSSLQDYTILAQDEVSDMRPHSLVFDIQLQMVSRASDIDANVVGREFSLVTKNPNYELNVTLPFEVVDEPLKAKFNVSTGLLTLEFATIKNVVSKSPLVSPTLSADSGIECEYGYRTNSDMDNNSLSSEEDNCDSEKSDTKDHIYESNIGKFVLSPCTFSQTRTCFLVSVLNANIMNNSVNIAVRDSQCFSFNYSCVGGGLAPINFGGLICVKPNCIIEESLKFQITGNVLEIQAVKRNENIWDNVLFGLEEAMERSISLVPEEQPETVAQEEDEDIYTNETAQMREIENGYKKSAAKAAHATEESEDMEGADVQKAIQVDAKNEDGSRVSKCIKISRLRHTSDCFVTGSWPKGILKGRARSYSDSHVDSVFICGSPDYEDDAVLEEGKEFDESEDQMGEDSLSSKKCVHFNDFVSRQVYKANTSILGQRAKNQKKAQQKKRARERKLSEGNSYGQSHSDFSDTTTTATEEESNTEHEIARNSDDVKPKKKSTKKQKKNGKSWKTSSSGKGKKLGKRHKKLPNLSNDLIFQLDDS